MLLQKLQLGDQKMKLSRKLSHSTHTSAKLVRKIETIPGSENPEVRFDRFEKVPGNEDNPEVRFERLDLERILK